jgi:nucleoid DNA-binding protein
LPKLLSHDANGPRGNLADPALGEAVKIAACTVPKFDAAKAMKEGLNTERRTRKG